MMMWLPSLQSWATWQQAMRKFLSPMPGDAVLFFAAAVDRHAFANRIAVADNDLRVAAGIADILRLAADHDVGINQVVVADGDAAHDRHAIEQPRAAFDLHVRADDRKRADFDVVVDFRRRIDRRGCSNASCHRRILRIAAIIWQWKSVDTGRFLPTTHAKHTFSEQPAQYHCSPFSTCSNNCLRQLRMKLMAAAVTHHVADHFATR